VSEYEWGVEQTFSAEWGGYTRQVGRNSEADARAIIDHWKRNAARGQPSNIVAMTLIRRPIGEWEEVPDA
jgi:hypothetical protein